MNQEPLGMSGEDFEHALQEIELVMCPSCKERVMRLVDYSWWKLCPDCVEKKIDEQNRLSLFTG